MYNVVDIRDLFYYILEH